MALGDSPLMDTSSLGPVDGDRGPKPHDIDVSYITSRGPLNTALASSLGYGDSSSLRDGDSSSLRDRDSSSLRDGTLQSWTLPGKGMVATK